MRAIWTNSTFATSLVISSAPVAGDFLIAYAVSDSGDLGISTWPSGFTQRAIQYCTFDSQRIQVATKIADGTEGNITLTSNDSIIGGIIAYANIDQTTPLDVAVVVANDNTADAAPWTIAGSITPVTNGATIVAIAAYDQQGATTQTTTAADTGALSWTTLASQVSAPSAWAMVGVAEAVQATAAATTVTLTGTTGSTENAGRTLVLLALRPAAAPDPIARPAADIAANGWTPSTGGVLAAMLDETAADDADYIRSPVIDGNQGAAIMTLSATKTGAALVPARARKFGTGTAFRVSFLDDANAYLGGTAWQAVTETFTTYQLPATITGTATRFRIEVQ
jgi:hypothetical protein